MIEPTGYRILLKQLPQDKTSEGGLILHSQDEHLRQQTGYNVCKVISMGKACYKLRDPEGTMFSEGEWCKVGDTVYIDNYAGKMIKPDELMSFVSEDEKKELKEMKDLKLSFHIVQDEHIQGVIR